MLIDTNTEKSIKEFLVNSAVVGTNLVLEPGKKCYNAEIWLKHPKIYVQYLEKKSHEPSWGNQNILHLVQGGGNS